jgi:hypothetical protein
VARDWGRGPMSPARAPVHVAEASAGEVRARILHVPGCPNVGRLRTDLEAALASVGASGVIEKVEGPYPSPTLLIDGTDVTGRELGTEATCRLDLPTRDQIVSAMLAACARSGGSSRAQGSPR